METLERLIKEREENWRAGKPEDWRLQQRIELIQKKLGLVK